MIKRSKGEKAFNVFNIIILTFGALLFIMPYWLIISASFTDELTLLKSGGISLFPKKFSTYAYEFLFTTNNYMLLSIWNSVKMTVLGTLITTFTCLLTAYPVSKKYLVGRRGIMVYIIFTMLFGGGLIPSYLLVSSIFPDTMWAIIIPGALAPYYLILIRNYFMSIPDSLEEAATLDGASNMRIFLKIYLPLSVPVIATIVLFCAVSVWNNWFRPHALYQQQGQISHSVHDTATFKFRRQYARRQFLHGAHPLGKRKDGRGRRGVFTDHHRLSFPSEVLYQRYDDGKRQRIRRFS